jgi:hypothetical protein
MGSGGRGLVSVLLISVLLGAACDSSAERLPSPSESTDLPGFELPTTAPTPGAGEAYEEVPRVKPPKVETILSKKKLRNCLYKDPLDPSSLAYFGPLDLIEDQVEMSRSLQMEPPATVRTIPSKAFSKEIEKAAVQLPKPQLAILRNLSRALGVVPAHKDATDFLKGDESRLVLGFYDQRKDAVVVRKKGKLDVELPVLAHEFAHAAADQRFGLPKSKPGYPFDDRNLAVDSLIEGDAMLVELRFISRFASRKQVSRALDKQVDFRSHFRKDRKVGLPFLFIDNIAFPYGWGPAFVCAVFKERGWHGVNEIYQRLPENTAQIMFPNRYLRKEGAIKPPSFANPSGPFKVVASGEIGAAHLKSLFEAPGDNEKKGLTRPYSRAAAWAGGRFVLWEDKEWNELYVVGVSLKEHADYPGLLCSSMHEWYRRAFQDHRLGHRRIGDATVKYNGYYQTALISCDGDVVRMGLGPTIVEARLPFTEFKERSYPGKQ